MSSILSPELHALLESKLDTFEKLEVVLSLSAAGRPLTIGELAHELQVGRDVLQRVADSVVDTGIIVRSDDEAFSLHSGRWDAAIAEAARLHASQPQLLMRAMTRIAMERIRGMSARTFADAFRIRKKGD